MKKILYENNGDIFVVSDQFESIMLVPIIRNLQDKAEHGWDDYDEVHHCMQLIATATKIENISMEFHSFYRDEKCVGTLLISKGNICGAPYFKPALSEEMAEDAVVLNYFHISKEGRGNGQRWLKEVVMPYYQQKGVKQILVKSSHPKAFSLYQRLGNEIGRYTTVSDTGVYEREGKIFSLPLQDMQLQKAGIEDFAKVRNAYIKIINETPNLYHYAKWEYGKHPSDESLLDYIKEGSMYLYLDGEELLGVVAITPYQGEEYLSIQWGTTAGNREVNVLHLLAVMPGMQRRGIGSKMIRAALELTKEMGMKACRLDTLKENVPAQHCYESMGFQLRGKKGWLAEPTGWLDFYLYEYVIL